MVLRLFIAIDVPEDIKQELRLIQGSLSRCRSRVRWIEPDGIHLTLRFLGNVDENRVGEIEGVLDQATKGYSPFELIVEDIGCFPDIRKPRVIWAGAHVDDTLLSLHGEIEEGLFSLGFMKGERPFHPHLTLGRIKEAYRMEWEELIAPFRGKRIGRFRVNGIILFQSILRSTGAIYKKVSVSELRGGEGP